MKCPKCDLVTFDHLATCPRCATSFRLSRRLTRRRRDPGRRIVLQGADGAAARAASPTPPAARAEASEIHPGLADLAAAEARLTEIAAPAPTVIPPLPPDIGRPAEELTDPAAAEDMADSTATADVADITAPNDEEVPGTREDAEPGPAPRAPAAAEARPEPDAHARDAADLKQRMVQASRARRKQRDVARTTVDPILPDWYEPGTESSAETPVLAGRSADS